MGDWWWGDPENALSSKKVRYVSGRRLLAELILESELRWGLWAYWS